MTDSLRRTLARTEASRKATGRPVRRSRIDPMAKTWVLDTETKGTGAQMVPIEKAHDGSARAGRSGIVVRERKPSPPKPVAPSGPRRFRVVDVMTKRVLAEDAPLDTTVELLEGVRSIVDVSILVWEPGAGRWQELSLREKQMLWGFRGRHA